MKRAFPPALVLAFIASAGFFQPANAASKTYRDAKQGYSITIPAAWTAAPTGDNLGPIEEFTPSDRELASYKRQGVTYSVYVRKSVLSSSEKAVLARGWLSYQAYVRSAFAKAGTINAGPTSYSLKNYRGLAITMTQGKSRDWAKQQTIYASKDGKTVYEITAVTVNILAYRKVPADTFASVFQSLAQSLTIL